VNPLQPPKYVVLCGTQVVATCKASDGVLWPSMAPPWIQTTGYLDEATRGHLNPSACLIAWVTGQMGQAYNAERIKPVPARELSVVENPMGE
jgi:hypothetical protein